MIRAMLYYLMELPPYVPQSMQNIWFETEAEMLNRGSESASGLLAKIEPDLVTDITGLDFVRLYRLQKLKEQHDAKPGSMEHYLAYKVNRNYDFEQFSTQFRYSAER